MPYNFVAEGFHTKKLCSRLSSSGVKLLMENGRFAFLSLAAMYDVHLNQSINHSICEYTIINQWK